MQCLKIFLFSLFIGMLVLPCYAQSSPGKDTVVGADKQLETFLKGDIPVLIDFNATWCLPCRLMKPVMEELEKNWAKKAHIVSVDVDKYRDLRQKYAAYEIPFFVLIVKGKVVWTGEGEMSKQTLEDALKSAAKN